MDGILRSQLFNKDPSFKKDGLPYLAAMQRSMEERVGFEPTIPIPRENRFRGGRFRPLSHLSAFISKYSKDKAFSSS